MYCMRLHAKNHSLVNCFVNCSGFRDIRSSVSISFTYFLSLCSYANVTHRERVYTVYFASPHRCIDTETESLKEIGLRARDRDCENAEKVWGSWRRWSRRTRVLKLILCSLMHLYFFICMLASELALIIISRTS